MKTTSTVHLRFHALFMVTAIALRASLTRAYAAQSQQPAQSQQFLLTYLQSTVETTDGVTTSATDYLQVSTTGAHSAKIITPSGATHEISLDAPQTASSADDDAAQCYRLATNLLPAALQVAPGTHARGGELNVTTATALPSIPVNFTAQLVAPGITRVYVYGDETGAVRFNGALDLERGIIMAATFTVQAASAQSAISARKCQINLVVPAVPRSKT